ncbi:MAG: hypothetical protein HZB46_18545 [Solirubrobacterales bacterium]|nr:hypothetical protein [Solirubrobacterales bacterium]
MLQLVGISAELVVEGEDDDAGAFSGRVLAIAADSGAGGPPGPSTTWLLVVDDRRPEPVWVSQAAVSSQRLGR